jgi:hypothetical protein
MAYGKFIAILEEAEGGNALTIRVELPESGEPAKSGRSNNLIDPNEWAEVLDQFGTPTGLQVRLNVVAPYRRAAELRLRESKAFSEVPRLVRNRPM